MPWRAATTPKKSFVELPTTAPKKSTQTMPATLSKKRESLSTRSGEMSNLSQNPQVIPLRSASEAWNRRIRGDIGPVKQSEMNVA